jgi:hypothetical protein
MYAGGVYSEYDIRASARFHDVPSPPGWGPMCMEGAIIGRGHDQDFAGWQLFTNSVRNLEPGHIGIDTSTTIT